MENFSSHTHLTTHCADEIPHWLTQEQIVTKLPGWGSMKGGHMSFRTRDLQSGKVAFQLTIEISAVAMKGKSFKVGYICDGGKRPNMADSNQKLSKCGFCNLR